MQTLASSFIRSAASCFAINPLSKTPARQSAKLLSPQPTDTCGHSACGGTHAHSRAPPPFLASARLLMVSSSRPLADRVLPIMRLAACTFVRTLIQARNYTTIILLHMRNANLENKCTRRARQFENDRHGLASTEYQSMVRS